MATRGFDPFRLDVQAFAEQAETLEGHWPLARFDRLVEAASDESPPGATDSVAWQVRGETRRLRGGQAQVWMHLYAATGLALACQRCLRPVAVAVEAQRSFLFVHGEGVAAQLDADSEDDVLAISRAFDLRELIEDELLLALPLVPRHETCPQPLPFGSGDDVADAPTENPFAALATLKRNGSLN